MTVVTDYSKYEKLAKLGTDPRSVYLTARVDELGSIDSLKMLRQVFGLSLTQAKEVMVIADGLGTSLEDYQAKQIPAIQKAL